MSPVVGATEVKFEIIGSAMVFTEVDWMMVLSASVIAGLLSLLTSIAGLPELKEG